MLLSTGRALTRVTAATVRYLDPDNETGVASDSNSGLDLTAPWLTLQHAVETVPDVENAVVYTFGDMQPTSATSLSAYGQMLLDNPGARTNLVTVAQHPSESPWTIVPGTNVTRPDALFSECTGVRLIGVTVEGCGLVFGHSTEAKACNDIEILSPSFVPGPSGLPGFCKLKNGNGSGFLLEDADFDGSEDLAAGGTMLVISGLASDTPIHDVTVRRCLFHDGFNADCIQPNHYDGLVLEDVERRNWYVDDDGGLLDPHADGLQVTLGGTGLVIRRWKELVETAGTAIRLSGTAMTDTLLEQCVIHNMDGTTPIKVALVTTPDLRLVGNTFNCSVQIGDDHLSGGTAPVLFGNILDVLSCTVAPSYEDYNAIRSRSGLGSNGANTITADMRSSYVSTATGDFRPAPAAAVLGEGAASGGGITLPTLDADLVTRPNPPAIGALEPA